MYGTMKRIALSAQTLRKAAFTGASFAAILMLAAPAHANSLVVNGSFETNGGPGQIGFNTTLTGWNAPGGSYMFLFNPGSADTTGVNGQYGNLALWGPNSGSPNGMPATSPDGGYYAALDGDFQIAALSQTVTGLTPGDAYTVSFWYAASQQTGFSGPTVQAMNVCLGSSAESYLNTGTQPLSGGNNNPANLNCPGSGASTPNISLASHDFSGWQYDSVSLNATSSTEVLSFLAYGNLQVPPFALLDGVSMAQTPEPGSLPLLFTGLMGGLTVLRSKKWLKR
jgi:hypothetical protein